MGRKDFKGVANRYSKIWQSYMKKLYTFKRVYYKLTCLSQYNELKFAENIM